ncbi:CPBP family intramembrane metalloprotease [Corynebacterium sp. 3HC-13]|uniref:CPBP family intramembrane glutamic endopeptidase n=1 Tax=Corynebacterium poyangense TaxID=2684405 RepID=UPI001CCC9AA3|nr:CPBP family intramembrane glutamic endopeptidase [Corynebacterium poyangense]MBZ8176233.1 CPBP family intramembrane metalloprotease [Corynebacterium poyangense]
MGLHFGTGLGQERNLSFWIVLCSCVVAPIAEEIAWRGVMLRALAPWGKTAAV